MLRFSLTRDPGEIYSQHVYKTSSKGNDPTLMVTLDLSERLRTEQARRTLLENAQKYYRGALAIAKNDRHARSSDVQESTIKETLVAAGLMGTSQNMVGLLQQNVPADTIQAVLRRMVQESVIGQDFLGGLGVNLM